MICLSPSAHIMHTKGFIAFEPCAKDPEGYWMTLQLWWLKPSGPGNFSFATTPKLLSSFDLQSVDLELHNVRSNVPLYSREALTLKTHNPQTHPLPDMQLLELQWILNQVAAI